MKFILGKDLGEKIYFNLDTLKRITNPDNLIDSLKKIKSYMIKTQSIL
jgi:hypothetical protein